MSDEGERWVDAATVAAALGTTTQSVSRRCRRGEIPSTRLAEGGQWRISRAWLKDVLDRAKRVVVRRREG